MDAYNTDYIPETGPPLILSHRAFQTCNALLDIGQPQNCSKEMFTSYLANFFNLANQGDKETLAYLAKELDNNKNGARNVLAILARRGLTREARKAINGTLKPRKTKNKR